MQIRFTSAVWEDVGPVVNEAMTTLENLIAPAFDGKVYGAGISIFQGVLVAIGDSEENVRFTRGFNKVGWIAAIDARPRKRFLNLSVVMAPSELDGLTVEGVRQVFCQSMSAALKAPPLKLPRGFAYEEFARELDTMLTLAGVASQSP